MSKGGAAENEKQRETNHCDKESECSSVKAERPETENSESDKSNETINRDDTGKEMKSVDEANDPDETNIQQATEQFAMEGKDTTQEADKVKENVEDKDKNTKSKTDNGLGSTKGDEETNGKEHELFENLKNDDDADVKVSKRPGSTKGEEETNVKEHEPYEHVENTELLSVDECARVSENMKNDKDADVNVSDWLGSTKGDEETNGKEHEPCERVEKNEQLSVDECARGNEAVINEQNEACSDDEARMMDEIYEARSLVKDELRIVLIGKTGSGKSATGNLLTGTKTFDSTASASSVTKYSQSVKYERFGRHLQVVDTPGMFDTQATDSEITKEIKRCLLLTSPGIHALVLVSRVGRFTEEERNCVEFFKNVFGSGLTNYLMIVFTGKDDLDDDDKSVESYLRTAPPSLQDLVGEANNRYIAINNKTSKKEKEATARGLIELISEMVEKNGGNCYTSDLFRKAEEVIKQREEEERKRIEEKKKLERESIENNVKEKFDVVLKEQEKSMTRLMKDMEKQEKRHDKQMMDLKKNFIKERKEQAERYEDMLRNERKENKRRRKEERRIREQERIAAQQQQLHDHQANVAEPEKNRSCSVM